MPSLPILIAAALLAQTSQDAAPIGAPAPVETPIDKPSVMTGGYCNPNLYPVIALKLNKEGTTQVDVDVTALGTVANVTVKRTSGFSPLDAAAIVCLKTWTFHPGTQNGAPVEAHIKFSIPWVLRPAGAPLSAVPPSHALPPLGPAGWLEDQSAEQLNGVLAYYKLTSSDAASGQLLTAEINDGFADLDDFITKNHRMIARVEGAQITTEAKTTICGGETAWQMQMQYSQPWPLPSSPNVTLDFEQVAAVRNHYAYISVYIRPAQAPERPEAEQWIRLYCESRK